jgi:hypothetical protein
LGTSRGLSRCGECPEQHLIRPQYPLRSPQCSKNKATKERCQHRQPGRYDYEILSRNEGSKVSRRLRQSNSTNQSPWIEQIGKVTRLLTLPRPRLDAPSPTDLVVYKTPPPGRFDRPKGEIETVRSTTTGYSAGILQI